MKTSVARLAWTVVSLGPLLLASSTPSRAEITYPFCKLGGGDLGTGSGYCNFSSFEQCRIASAGYGICQANPAYVPPAAPPAGPRRAKRD